MTEPPNPYGPRSGGGYGPPPPSQGPYGAPRPPQQPGYGPPGPGYGGEQGYGQPQSGYPGPAEEPRRTYPSSGPSGPHPAENLPLAAFKQRAFARLIDAGLVWVAGFALVFPIVLAAIGVNKDEDGGWSTPVLWTTFIVVAVLPFVYEAVQLALWGRTLGKRQIGLRVVLADPAGDPLPIMTALWRAAVNNLGYMLGVFLFLLLGVKVWAFFLFFMFVAAAGVLMAYLWAIWDRPLFQAIHDRYAGTVVVDDHAEWNP
ncbi:RDD family protein [Actinocorallia populi]|uniref:RDD family protein n=1 Tax=Actinocorallia populi TaxID=2079200 RepID=UPI000D088FEA|nr:RDD family protein [Actinocorallia populi]